MLIHEPIELIHSDLVKNEKILSILGPEWIEDLIVIKPTLNVTELGEKSNAKHFITLSVFQISEFETNSQWILKVGVATDVSSNSMKNFRTLSELMAEVIKTITSNDLNFGFPEQIEFTEAEETFFDDHKSLWGYTIFFVVNDEEFRTSVSS